MIHFVEERSLHERLASRRRIEERFLRTGRRFRNKHFLLKHERVFVRPLLKFGLKALGIYSRGVRNAITPVVRRLNLEFDHLPAAYHGFKILHISDLHIDGVHGLDEALLPILRGLHADLCVITGDYRFEDDGPCEAVYPRMQSIVSNISSAHGIFGILGNHDVSEIAIALEDMGVKVLINESAEIRRSGASIWVVGTDDSFDYRCADLSAALDQVPAHAFKILLHHTPDLYEEAARENVALYLCGHTHAGQIRFPKIGSLRHNSPCPKMYSFGHWMHCGMQGYTSAGTGSSGLPIRYNCPAELTLIELRRAANSRN